MKQTPLALASLLMLACITPAQAVDAPPTAPATSSPTPTQAQLVAPTTNTGSQATAEAKDLPASQSATITAPVITEAPTQAKSSASASATAQETVIPWARSASEAETGPKAAGEPTVNTHGAIGARWVRDGGENSSYGNPIDQENCTASGICYQRFERGTLVWSAKTGVHLLTGAIQEKWWNAGGPNSAYGAPASDERKVERGGVEQLFLQGDKNGAIYWTPWGTGTYYVNFQGGIGGHWANTGNFRQANTYGFPVSEEECGFTQGSCFQRFEYGTIVWSPAFGSVRIGGAIRSLWESQGGMESPYGIPVRSESHFNNGQAAEQLFQRNGADGAIYWTNWGTGTHFVNFRGAIGSFWANNGNFRDEGTDTPLRYGFPTTEEICANGACYQKFQYGIVTWSPAWGGVGGSEAQKCMALNDGRSKYLPQGAHRVALALAPRYAEYQYDWGGTHGTFYSCREVFGFYVQDWKTEAAFGERGFLAPWRQIIDSHSGHLMPPGVTGDTAGARNPTGSFSLSNPFGAANPGTGFSGYHTVVPGSRWGGDPFTWYYNKYVVDSSLGYLNEDMNYFKNRGDYEQGVNIDYNRNPDGSIPSGDAGFAIMVHTTPYTQTVAQNYTWGCIAIDRAHIYQFLREGHDGDRIIMGVESEIMNW